LKKVNKEKGRKKKVKEIDGKGDKKNNGSLEKKRIKI
jgi:hypothetical protein